MSLPSAFQASGPLPSATFAGWDAQTDQKTLWTPAAVGPSPGLAVGPAGAVQFSDGAGNFQGTANTLTTAGGALSCETLQTVNNLTVGANAAVAGNLVTTGTTTVGATGGGGLFAGAATLGSVIFGNVGLVSNSGSNGQAIPSMGFSGTRRWVVNIPANATNFDVGLNAIINSAVPHVFFASIIQQGGAAYASSLIQSYPAVNNIAPSFALASVGNGYAFPAIGGSAGAWTFTVNSTICSATNADVVITIIY